MLGEYSGSNSPASGKQILSTKPTSYSVPMSTQERKTLALEGADILVGPGEYGDTHLKKYNYGTDASFSFSVAGRKRPAVGDPTALGGNRVGPNTKVHSSIGKQHSSTRRTAPSCTMSGREKFGSPTLW